MSAECERLLMMLTPSAMEKLRVKFETHVHGVSINQFVMLLGQVLPAKYKIDEQIYIYNGPLIHKICTFYYNI